ncbi:phenylalanyl-tRNA synthetase alpha subunit, mitochondrial, variant 3 [Entomophthora muscae]|uniref:Phenylalanyl-tRNA synthetase alpha subunit, mitochondrial, variant 3 n=1 Tax=Entomophthora muscae TaxID=34485 RepID=A0ACC2SUC7_9FUNG|nr:phenylalanyl-tRNA synthetase alpha subunit, mitochondrial, variant 3 [Entomophthora muscae]
MFSFSQTLRIPALLRNTSSLRKDVFRCPRFSLVSERSFVGTYKKESEKEYTEFKGEQYFKDDYTNVTPTILGKIGENLHNVPSHPLCLLKERIHACLEGFTHYDSFSPVVKVRDNFDRLLIEPDHPGRSKSDSFFFNRQHMLRTHTTTHELDVYEHRNIDKFTITADVYRRDEIDSSHYPVFHQMECVHLLDRSEIAKNAAHATHHPSKTPAGLVVSDPTSELSKLSESNPIQSEHSIEEVEIVAYQLKATLNHILYQLFAESAGSGDSTLEIRWIEAFFPFTSPSWEVEIFYQGAWLEVLGCGILKQKILDQAGRSNSMGWACGLGLERLAMVLHKIPDIRLFWSKDARFLDQFQASDKTLAIFRPFSKFPPCTRDIAFWCSSLEFEANDLFDLVRDIAGDFVESVSLIDSFVHPKSGRKSMCYRIVYRSMDRYVFPTKRHRSFILPRYSFNIISK